MLGELPGDRFEDFNLAVSDGFALLVDDIMVIASGVHEDTPTAIVLDGPAIASADLILDRFQRNSLTSFQRRASSLVGLDIGHGGTIIDPVFSC